MHAEEPAVGDLEPRYRSEWARRFVIVVIVAFSVAAIGNIAMEASYKPEFRALMVHEGGALSTATATDPSRSRGRYWIASSVHDVAFGGVFVVPDRALTSWYRFEELADVDVVEEGYDPNLTAEQVATLDGLPTIEGVGNIRGLWKFKPFRVVWTPDGEPVPVLRLWYFGETKYLIDDRIVMSGES